MPRTDPPLGPALPDAALSMRALGQIRTLALWLAIGAVCLVSLLVSAPILPVPGLAAELRGSAVAAIPLSGILLALAGVSGTWIVVSARAAARDPALLARVGISARVPQAVVVPALAFAAIAVAWVLRPQPVVAEPPSRELSMLLGAAAVALSFPLLVAERSLAATSPQRLPEAPALRALLLLVTLMTFAAGVLQIALTVGLTFAARCLPAMGAIPGAVAAELALRALARLFLPPPAPGSARGAARSLLAGALAAGVRRDGGIGAPLRQHFGIDFARSWALAYAGAAALPVAGLLAALAFLLSGVTLVPLEGRAIYERLGVPSGVLHPGLHWGLPWPMGRARAVEYGPLHTTGLVPTADQTRARYSAEEAAPTAADRLWEQTHPSEVTLLVASGSGNRQSFQSISVDLRVLYRVGLSDEAALAAAYAVAEPEALVRAATGRVATGTFAVRRLDDALGADLEDMAVLMRERIQAHLDSANAGLEVVAVVIEAIHPPAGAADAYHAVRAAEINARASVSVERGSAAVAAAQARQYGFTQRANADANAAERVQAALTARLRFEADARAAAAGGQSFRIERYFTALADALARAPKTILDHRLGQTEAPVLDLRPLASAVASLPGKEE